MLSLSRPFYMKGRTDLLFTVCVHLLATVAISFSIGDIVAGGAAVCVRCVCFVVIVGCLALCHACSP